MGPRDSSLDIPSKKLRDNLALMFVLACRQASDHPWASSYLYSIIFPMLKRSLLFIFPGILVWLLIDQYIICPDYQFESPGPFKGATFYNPYQHYDPEEWTLANMHAHTSSWFGLTNGKGDAKDVHEAYDSMGYGFHLISEYQKISDYGKGSPNYITAYEHGLNLPKAHQLVVGSERSVWKDYFFPQTLANRQHMLDLLSADTGNVVVVNHPAMRIGYNPTDMKFLYNYDCMEVINSYENAFRYWDTALSNGHMVFIVGNDDTHNADNRRAVGKFATLLHSPNRTRIQALRSIREGRTIGVQIPQDTTMTFPQKIAMLKMSSPSLISVSADSAVFRVRFDKTVSELVVTGQGGMVRWQADSASDINMPILASDTYLRVSYRTPDGIRYHLNPVCRFQGIIGNRRQTARL
jgi:hypothetical protein